MGIVNIVKNVKLIHKDYVALVRVGKFYNCYGRDSYIVNGKIICRKMVKKNVVFPTFFCIKNSMI